MSPPHGAGLNWPWTAKELFYDRAADMAEFYIAAEAQERSKDEFGDTKVRAGCPSVLYVYIDGLR